jgi:hypothetical protein
MGQPKWASPRWASVFGAEAPFPVAKDATFAACASAPHKSDRLPGQRNEVNALHR